MSRPLDAAFSNTRSETSPKVPLVAIVMVVANRQNESEGEGLSADETRQTMALPLIELMSAHCSL